MLVHSVGLTRQTKKVTNIILFTSYSTVMQMYYFPLNETFFPEPSLPWTQVKLETKETRFKLTQDSNLNEQTNSSDV